MSKESFDTPQRGQISFSYNEFDFKILENHQPTDIVSFQNLQAITLQLKRFEQKVARDFRALARQVNRFQDDYLRFCRDTQLNFRSVRSTIDNITTALGAGEKFETSLLRASDDDLSNSRINTSTE